MNESLVTFLLGLSHSEIQNYVIPGLTSGVVGGRAADGSMVRIFHNLRNHEESIVPHSHRFDFHAIVLRGKVTNRVWQVADANDPKSEPFMLSAIECKGQGPGKYTKRQLGVSNYRPVQSVYTAGQSYKMDANEIHSIFFEKETVVLFFEGRELTKESCVLEPYVNGQVIPTFVVEPWMFQRAGVKQ